MSENEWTWLLEDAESGYSRLPLYMKAQAGEVILPMLAMLRGLLDRVEKLEEKNGN